MAEALTAREFRRAAEQRLAAANFLLAHDFTLDALYLAGYSVECAFKALIMHLAPVEEREEMFRRLKSGARMHDPEYLKEELNDLGHPVPADLVKRLRRFGWSTHLRYASARRPTSEVRGYIKAARTAIAWADGEMT